MIIYTPDNIKQHWVNYLAERNVTLQPGQAMVAISIVQKHTWERIHEANTILEQYGVIHKFNHANGTVAVVTQDVASILKLAL